MAELPEAFQVYGDVVITPSDGLAHRRGLATIVVGTHDRWDAERLEMVKVETTRSLPYAGCQPRPVGTPERVSELSAGWATHLGYEACPTCFP